MERQTDSRGHKESPTLPLKDANTATPNLIQTNKLTQTLTLTWKRRVTLRLKRTLRHVHKSGIQVGHKLWLWLWSRDTLWRVHKEASFFINVLEERLKTSDLIICLIFFSVRERAEFNKSCNLIGSGSGRNFPIRPALGGRNHKTMFQVCLETF